MTNVPPSKDIVAESIRGLSSKHIDKSIIIYGTVVRASNMKARKLKQKLECAACGWETVAESDIGLEELKYNKPLSCGGQVEKKENPFFDVAKKIMAKTKKGRGEERTQQNPQQKGMTNCRSTRFVEVDDPAYELYSDYQEVKMQELFRTFKPGLIPRAIKVALQNTLVETCKPGDDIMVTGTLIRRWKDQFPFAGSRPPCDLIIAANNVEVLNKRDFQRGNQITMDALQSFKTFWKKHDRIKGGKVLVNSVLISIFEREEIKLGLLLSLIGGVSQKCDDNEKGGLKIRGNIHMLMVGEPGTGKSQFLQAAH